MEEKIAHFLASHIETSATLADQLSPLLVQAGLRLTESLLDDGKVLLCARGRSFPNGLHFASAMLNRYEVERPPLPIIILGGHVPILQQSMFEDHEDHVFLREIQALGQSKDILLILVMPGEAIHWIQAIYAAKEKGMTCIIVSAAEEVFADYLGPLDVELRLPPTSAARVVEMQLLVLHGFCEVIDHALFAQIVE